MKNKIKYNLKNVHFAEQEESEDGTITFSTPEPIPGSVSLALDSQGEVTKFHADGIIYYKSVSNNGYEGDLEVALIPESFRTKIYGEKLDTKKVLVERQMQSKKHLHYFSNLTEMKMPSAMFSIIAQLRALLLNRRQKKIPLSQSLKK